MNNSSRQYPIVRPGTQGNGIAILLCSCLFMLVVVAFLSQFIFGKFGLTASSVRIVSVLQDLLVFMLPALLTAMLVTRLPATFLQIDRRGGIAFSLMAVLCLLLSVPMMNVVVEWNANIKLPASMADFEQWARSLETGAADTVNLMIGNQHTIGSLFISIAIIGVLAPLVEELFFRGALQGLLMSIRRMNPHIAIWIVAVVFSIFHMQFFGFIPRILLGAFFGYLVYWSGSLWTSVLAHAVNNSIIVVAMWRTTNDCVSDLDKFATGGTATDYVLICASLLLTASALTWMVCHRTRH